jgi:hypothetical protein
MPYVGDYVDRIRNHFNPPLYFNQKTPDFKVINRVLKASIEMDGTYYNTSQPKRGLVYDVNQFLDLTPLSRRTNDLSVAMLYAGLSEWAYKKNDIRVLEYLVSKMEIFINDERLNYTLDEVDQVPIGICFINLYRITKNKKYLHCSKAIYTWLLSRREKGNNLIYYRKNSPNQFVDALGLYIPFLVEYSELTGDTLAHSIAEDNFMQFYKYGVDKETGIPCHGYNIETHIKVGSANWGRGIGWYVLAASFLPEFSDPHLDKVLHLISKTQFPESSHNYDSSTALLFEIYMQSRGFHPKSIEFIKPHILESGFVTGCSGDTYDFNNHSYYFGSAEMTNGFFLMLASQF